jgi:hypothetical protein
MCRFSDGTFFANIQVDNPDGSKSVFKLVVSAFAKFSRFFFGRSALLRFTTLLFTCSDMCRSSIVLGKMSNIIATPRCRSSFFVVTNVPTFRSHDILMATMLNGAAVMDAALLLIAGNESWYYACLRCD